jgi:hypothetical protein
MVMQNLAHLQYDRPALQLEASAHVLVALHHSSVGDEVGQFA